MLKRFVGILKGLRYKSQKPKPKPTIKPRLRYSEFFNDWVCESPGDICGLGYTPAEAYSSWERQYWQDQRKNDYSDYSLL